MDINKFAGMIDKGCYGFLAINAAWGLYCAVRAERSISDMRFQNINEQDEFIDEFAASRQELLYQLKEASGASPWEVRVQVKANGLAEHGTVVMVLDVGRVLGCKSIQLVTDADL